MVSSPGPAAASSPPPRIIRRTTESRADHAELRGLLVALRRELWWRQGLATVLVSVAVGALAAALLAWLGQPVPALLTLLACAIGGTAVALLRAPAAAHAALRADRELDL